MLLRGQVRRLVGIPSRWPGRRGRFLERSGLFFALTRWLGGLVFRFCAMCVTGRASGRQFAKPKAKGTAKLPKGEPKKRGRSADKKRSRSVRVWMARGACVSVLVGRSW